MEAFTPSSLQASYYFVFGEKLSVKVLARMSEKLLTSRKAGHEVGAALATGAGVAGQLARQRRGETQLAQFRPPSVAPARETFPARTAAAADTGVPAQGTADMGGGGCQPPPRPLTAWQWRRFI